ncbi:MAG: GNAT family N-acetyltransferase [Chloroflexi bacterium]|nr:GNAT family N-acetyltransferase [Chloroflexota bacterium]
MNIQPVTLEGRTVRIEPLDRRHAADMAEAADDDIFKYHVLLPEISTAGFERYIETLLSRPNMVPFAQVLVATGKAIGGTTYMDIQTANRGVEIGTTWIGRAYHGTLVNPEAKYLLLRHAFEDQGTIRVQLKTDGRNLQSQRAIEKLGAVREGVLRNHVVMPDGFLRASVMYSITHEEWPAVKARLEERLGY